MKRALFIAGWLAIAGLVYLLSGFYAHVGTR